MFPPMMLSRHMSIRQPNTKKKTPVTINIESPVSEEVIKSIPTFCFPDDMKIECYKPESKVHYLVLTDMSGDNTYATCVTFYRPFIVEKRHKYSDIMVIMERDSDSDDSDQSPEDDQSNIYMSLDTAYGNLKFGAKRCYIPHCCVLISKHPYFSVMKDCLSSMVHKVEEDPEGMTQCVKQFAHVLTMTPVPPAGNVAIEFNISVNEFTLYPPESADRPVVDIPLHLVFLCFQDDEIFKILSAMLVEERIVFLSSNFALLFIVMESFRYFILPFTWSSRFTYVPVLPAKSLELLEAPGTFMMGCHAIHKKEVEQVEGLVIVDIDAGTVTMNQNSDLYEEALSNGHSEGTADIFDIPNIPVEAAKVFSSVCKRARYQYDIADSQR
ncbi:hypothetical protein KUTeg_000063 [Tegillarca granosa]|uniref:UDENN domain-containing protein n=1 Tax=Tegillarca granosa TaxID=220873 RepID=A0ABQ9FWG4_TEGGR|nr:hypothetical protein KUTeg_000063 [Tegillarca granosa]